MLNEILAIFIWLGAPICVGYKRSYLITEAPKSADMLVELIFFAIVLLMVSYAHSIFMEVDDMICPIMILGSTSYALHLQTSLICYSFREFVAKRKLEKLNADKLD